MGYETSRPSGNDLPLTKGDVTGAASNIIDADLDAGKTLVSDAQGKVSASPITYAELTNISGAASAGTSSVSDNDGFLHNDNTTMKQTRFSKVWDWIVSKATGAVSTILTSNLTTNRMLISNSSGKVVVANALTAGRAMTVDANGLPTVSNVTTTELNKLDGSLTPESSQVDDNDGFLINIDGNLKQVRGDKVKEYVGLTGVPRVTYAGIVDANGNIVTTKKGSFSTSKASTGVYRVEGLSVSDVNKAYFCALPVGSRREIAVKMDTTDTARVYMNNNNAFEFIIFEWD